MISCVEFEFLIFRYGETQLKKKRAEFMRLAFKRNLTGNVDLENYQTVVTL